jgi:hypothetical protein
MTEPAPASLDYQPVWAREAQRKASGHGGPSFKGLILNLISVAVVVAVVAFFAAPAVAFFGIRAAAEAGDVAGLAKLIDYDAVRASLRPQLSGRVEPLTPPPSILQDPVGAIRRQFEDHPIINQPNVDAYLTPDAIWRLTSGYGRHSGADNPTALAPDVGGPPWPRPAYWSINRARFTVHENGTTVFTFERRGPYEWKLVHVGLPQDPEISPVRP